MARSAPSVLRNLIAYLLMAGLQMAVPLVTVPILTRCIRPEHYGVLDMLQIVMIVGIGLGNWGMINAFERYYFAYAATRDKQRRLLRTLVTFTVVCFAAVFAALLVARDPLASYLTRQDQWGPLVLIVFASGALNHLNGFFFIFLKNSEKAGSYAAYEAGRVVLSAGTSILLAAGLGYGIWGLVAGPLAVQAALFALFLLRFRIGRPGIDLAMLAESFRYGWPLCAVILAGIINITVDKFMLGKMLDPDKAMSVLGVYGRAQGLAFVIFAFLTTVQNVYAPKWSRILFRLDGQGDQPLGPLFTEYVCLICVPAAMMVLFCQEIVRVMTPPDYRGMTPLVIALVSYYALMAFGKLLGQVGSFLKMTKYIAVVTLVTTVLTIALNYVLIPRFESAGAVTTTCAVGLGATAFGLWYFSRRYTVRYEKARLVALYGGVFVCAAAAMACFYEVVPYWHGLTLRLALWAAFLGVWLKVVGPRRILTLLTEIRRSALAAAARPKVPTGEATL